MIGQTRRSNIILFLEIILMLNYIVSYAQAAVPSGENESDCTGCHDLDNIVAPENAPVNNIGSKEQDNSIIITAGTLINGLSEGGADCISCHDIGEDGSNKSYQCLSNKTGCSRKPE